MRVPPSQLNELERRACLGVALRLPHLALLEPVGHVVQHRHVGKQGVLLKDRVDVALVRRQADGVHAPDQDLAGVRLLEPRDEPERCGLPAARGAKEGEELTFADPEVDAVDRCQ